MQRAGLIHEPGGSSDRSRGVAFKRERIDSRGAAHTAHPLLTLVPSGSQAVPQSREQQSPEASAPRSAGLSWDFSRMPVHPPAADGAAEVAIAPKLRVGAFDDRGEHEADRVADQASRAETRELQKKPAAESRSSGGAAPGLVHDVVHSPGQALDASTRGFFEPRFGHDFSQVRVHSDVRAAESARAVNALAYTVGRDVVFGASQYAPGSAEGSRLLAHELTHVVQQESAGANPAGGVARLQRQQAPGQGGDAKQFVESSADFLETTAQEYRVDVQSRAVKLDEANFSRLLNRWKETLDKSETIIGSTLGNDPALTKRVRSAYQNVIGAAVAFAANRLNVTSHVVYEKYRLQIAEWALPQAVPEASANQLSDALPAAERTKLTLITSSVSFNIDDLFSTKTARTVIPLPAGVTARFASGVAPQLEAGLKSVAGTIVPTPLVLNSTMTLALDLEPYGGDYSSYRFTYVAHKPSKGKPTQEVLIEKLGAIGVEGLTKSGATSAQKRFDAHGFKRGAGWSDPDFDSVLGAIVQIPDSILSPVDGITFNRGQVLASDPTAGGNYNPDTHTITMFNLAFSDSTTRFGAPGKGTSTNTVRAVAHEVGHAVDLLPLRKAWAGLEAKRQMLKTAFAQFEDPPGSGNYSFPSTEQGKFNKLSAAIDAAEKALPGERSESGQRYKDVKGTFETVQGGTAAGSSEFRKAAEKDGGQRITAYSNKEWQEYYAESFSLYATDPAALARLRPNVSAFFSKKHPK